MLIEMQNFQGISNEGDFQSALQDAINKALKKLTFVDGAAISDQHIEWRLIEISGGRDALLGDQTIVVTIEALKTSKIN